MSVKRGAEDRVERSCSSEQTFFSADNISNGEGGEGKRKQFNYTLVISCYYTCCLEKWRNGAINGISLRDYVNDFAPLYHLFITLPKVILRLLIKNNVRKYRINKSRH